MVMDMGVLVGARDCLEGVMLTHRVSRGKEL